MPGSASEPNGQQSIWDLLGVLHWLVTFWGICTPCWLMHNVGGNVALPSTFLCVWKARGDEGRRHRLLLWAQAHVFLLLMLGSRAAASLFPSAPCAPCSGPALSISAAMPPEPCSCPPLLLPPGAKDCLILPLHLTLSVGSMWTRSSAMPSIPPESSPGRGSFCSAPAWQLCGLSHLDLLCLSFKLFIPPFLLPITCSFTSSNINMDVFLYHYCPSA